MALTGSEPLVIARSNTGHWPWVLEAHASFTPQDPPFVALRCPKPHIRRRGAIGGSAWSVRLGEPLVHVNRLFDSDADRTAVAIFGTVPKGTARVNMGLDASGMVVAPVLAVPDQWMFRAFAIVLVDARQNGWLVARDSAGQLLAESRLDDLPAAKTQRWQF